jgi:hypothetical protein
MKLFIVPPVIFPIEIPRILFCPDSYGTIFLGYFYSEYTFLSLNSCSAVFFVSFSNANFPTTFANKSVAPYGGFYF